MGFLGSLFGIQKPPTLKASRKHFNIVGEAKFQDNLSHLAGGKSFDGVKKEQEALLVLDDNNSSDKNAVRIDIRGKTVGYLFAEDAITYRNSIQVSKCRCECLIVGGWDRGSDDNGHFGVKLKLAWPPKLEAEA